MSLANLNLKDGELEKIVLCLTLFLISNFVLWTFKTFSLRNIGKKYPSIGENLQQLSRPMDLLVFSLGFSLSLQTLPERFRTHPLNIYGTKILLILVSLWITERMAKIILSKPKALGMSNEATRSLVLQICRLLIASLGVLILLDTVGISITPLLASLGVSSIAIALALQDTLGNFIAGVYLLVDQPIRVADNVRAPEGAEGIVRKIGWRSTHIENGLGHTIIIPNSKLSAAVITNFDIPTREVTVPILFTVDFATDPELLEQVTREVLSRTVQNHSGCLKSSTPSFVINQLRDIGIEIQVTLRLHRISEASQVKGYFFKNLLKDFKQANIKFAHVAVKS